VVVLHLEHQEYGMNGRNIIIDVCLVIDLHLIKYDYFVFSLWLKLIKEKQEMNLYQSIHISGCVGVDFLDMSTHVFAPTV